MKPKELKKMCVTNVHGSIEGQDVLKLVESIEMEKKKNDNQDKKKQQKYKEKELFYRCEGKCVYSGICAVKGLNKECRVCLEIKRSGCSKASCHIDGIKPKIIATVTKI